MLVMKKWDKYMKGPPHGDAYSVQHHRKSYHLQQKNRLI